MKRKAIAVAVSGTGEVSLENFVGRPVGEIRQAMITILNISSQAVATVNGKKAPDSYILEQSDKLEFVQASGRKG